MTAIKKASGIERGGFVLFLALISLAMLVVAWPFVQPLLWATLAAIMFRPLFLWIHERRPGSPGSCAFTSLIIIVFLILIPALWISAIVVRQAASVFTAFRSGDIDVASWFRTIFDALPVAIRDTLTNSGWGDFEGVQTRLQTLATESAGLIAQQAFAIGGGALSWVLAFGVGLYVTFFLLRDGQSIGQAIIRAAPLQRDIAERLAERFLLIVRATVKGSGVVAMVQGALGAITFWIVGMPSIALFGVLMSIFSLLPALGPAIVWAPVAIYLLATGAIWQGITVVISGVVVIGMADNVLRPILVGRDTGIPDWMILITTLGGIGLLGLSGIVLGPLVAGLFLASWAILKEQREADAA